MRHKKLFTGIAAMALMLTTGVAAYANTETLKHTTSNGMQYQEENMSGEGALTLDGFDKNNLPEGVQYTGEVSMDVEGALSLDGTDKNNLPDGVLYMDEISMGDEDSQSFPLNN